MYPPTSTGHYDVCGNLWEWGEDHLNGFPGGHTDYLYDDFSTPFYDGRHTMIMVKKSACYAFLVAWLWL